MKHFAFRKAKIAACVSTQKPTTKTAELAAQCVLLSVLARMESVPAREERQIAAVPALIPKQIAITAVHVGLSANPGKFAHKALVC